MKAITLIPVAPLRTTTSLAFVTRSTDTEGEGGGMEPVTWTTYPESPLAVEMRKLRRELGLHLGEAGVALGFDALTFSRLERGAFTMSEDERGRPMKRFNIYATGHDWRWDHADPTRNTATCSHCSVLTKLEGEERVYFRDGVKLPAFPDCRAVAVGGPC